MIGGLKTLSRDDRDFKVGALFQLPKLEELPDEFLLCDIDKLYIKNQGGDDSCAQQASTLVSELQEEVELNPYWTLAKSKEGNLGEWGQNLREAAKAHVTFGAIEVKDNDTKSKDIKDFPQLDGSKHKKASYMKVEGLYDSFDDIRATIYRFRNEKKAVFLGVEFGWSLKDKILEDIKGGYGHALAVIGWKRVNNVPYLVVVNSYGKEAGDRGTHLVSRKVINEFVPMYGAFTFTDKPREDIELMIENGTKFDGQPYTGLIRGIWNFIKYLFKVDMLTMEEKSEQIQRVQDLVKELPPVKEEVKEDKLIPFCKAIEEYEGSIPPSPKYPKGTPAWRNKNPGNIKGRDGKFLVFKTYEEGFEALKNYVKRVVRNEHRAYPKDCVLFNPKFPTVAGEKAGFFQVYAPSSDNNNPHLYAQFVADKVNVTIDTKLKDFIVNL